VVFLEEISGDEIRMKLPEVPPYGVLPNVPGLTQIRAKRIGLESYLAAAGQQ